MNYRYEDKFLVDFGRVSSMLSVIQGENPYFKKVFHERTVCSVYYDTDSYLLASQNINGDSRRHKLRLRFYGDDVSASFFEIKSKCGSVGSKVSHPVRVFNGRLPLATTLLNHQRLTAHTLASYGHLFSPKLLVVYRRHYFVSRTDTSIRLTFDSDINFKSLTAFSTTQSVLDGFCFRSSDSVLELKYPSRHGIELFRQFFSDYFSCRRSKYSKYVQGLLRTSQIRGS